MPAEGTDYGTDYGVAWEDADHASIGDMVRRVRGNGESGRIIALLGGAALVQWSYWTGMATCRTWISLRKLDMAKYQDEL